jgi:hypothetical protein
MNQVLLRNKGLIDCVEWDFFIPYPFRWRRRDFNFINNSCMFSKFLGSK